MLVLIVLGLCVSCDQVTKHVAKQNLSPIPRVHLWDGIVQLEYTENPGAFLSLGARLPKAVRFWTLVVFTGVMLLGMLVFVLRTREIGRLGVVAISLVIGGGTSNLLDRIRYDGAVVDFMNVGIGWLRTGIFNVADVAIMAGVGLLLIWSFHLDKSSTEPLNSQS